MMRLWAVIGLALALVVGPLQKSNAQENPLTEGVAYLFQVMVAAHTQVELAKVGVEKAQDPTIRAFAQRLLERYTADFETYAAAAQAGGLDPVAVLDTPTAYLLDVLGELEGEAFDFVYIAGVAPAIYSEHWVHQRTARHATTAAVRSMAQARIEDTKALWDRALRLASRREDALPDGMLHPNDSTVVLFGMNIDLAQVILGNVALERIEDEAIRAFAQRMVDDHQGSYDTFKGFAEEHGLDVLEEPAPLETALVDILKTLPDEAFQEAYLASQVIFHDNWYKRMEYTGYNGRDDDIKAYTLALHEVGMDHHDAVYAITIGADAAPSHGDHTNHGDRANHSAGD